MGREWRIVVYWDENRISKTYYYQTEQSFVKALAKHNKQVAYMVARGLPYSLEYNSREVEEWL